MTDPPPADEEPLPWMASSGASRPATPQLEMPLDAGSEGSEGGDKSRPFPTELRPGRDAREVRAAAAALLKAAQDLRAQREARKAPVLEQLGAVRRELALEHLRGIPVERLKEATEGRLRLGPLSNAGYRSVADVLAVQPYQLRTIPGVGDQTTTQIVAAARQLAKAVEETMPIRLDAEQRPASHTKLIEALRSYEDVDRLAAPVLPHLEQVQEQIETLLRQSIAASGRLRWLFAGKHRRAEAEVALRDLADLLQDPKMQGVSGRLRGIRSGLGRPVTKAAVLWADYEARAPDYYGLLGELGDLSLDVSALHGHIPTDLAEHISQQQLDTSWLRVSLRGYQGFGARFALVQRRSILGDEMGLGKTVEAIAVLAHLAALGESHFLVVCPASVLVNWTREISARSKLPVHRLHGTERTFAAAAWKRTGGVAVTTFDTLRHFAPDPTRQVAAIVVDEAHFVKNPHTKRAAYLQDWTSQVERVTFLTGTPMENRIDEFRNLVGYLQPDVARTIRNVSGVAGAAHFRTAVAPVYLRRNQEDVLSELPERLDMDDWVDLTDADLAQYREAVAARNFMGMRRAPLLAGKTRSAKLQRLAEIVEESADNGWKVVIFSYFHDVLHAVSGALDGQKFGPLTGAMAPAARQDLVDTFSSSPGHGVLLSQIQAGGTGLNMQAASVVVLTEPQWKPSIEEQAVARCHRMGQVRRVHVHRLLAQQSADQRMLEILSEKRALFDTYVRRSALRDATPDAVDISDETSARQALSFADAERSIIEAEQQRLGLIRPSDGPQR